MGGPNSAGHRCNGLRWGACTVPASSLIWGSSLAYYSFIAFWHLFFITAAASISLWADSSTTTASSTYWRFAFLRLAPRPTT